MKTVLLFGTFDFLHVGHLQACIQAKNHGEKLVVCVARDEAVQRLKGRHPIHTEEERMILVHALDVVDDVVLGDVEQGIYSCIETVHPDIIAIGYDQQALQHHLEMYLAQKGTPIRTVVLKAYEPTRIKSSTLTQTLTL